LSLGQIRSNILSWYGRLRAYPYSIPVAFLYAPILMFNVGHEEVYGELEIPCILTSDVVKVAPLRLGQSSLLKLAFGADLDLKPKF